jgi:hypothetical protein
MPAAAATMSVAEGSADALEALEARPSAVFDTGVGSVPDHTVAQKS